MAKKSDKLPWIFIDGASQEIFRIRYDDPAWEVDDDGRMETARCAFEIVADDGTAFEFNLQIAPNVLENQSVEDLEALATLIASKGVEIIEGAIHRGVRGDQQLVWEQDGVSIVN